MYNLIVVSFFQKKVKLLITYSADLVEWEPNMLTFIPDPFIHLPNTLRELWLRLVYVIVQSSVVICLYQYF